MSYSLADGRALIEQLRAQGSDTEADTVAWLCDRVEALEAQVASRVSTVEGVCSICGAKGWYVPHQKGAPSPSRENAVGLIGDGLARILGGQVPLRNRDGVLVCSLCLRQPT